MIDVGGLLVSSLPYQACIAELSNPPRFGELESAEQSGPRSAVMHHV